jgi:hypothetical protein
MLPILSRLASRWEIRGSIFEVGWFCSHFKMITAIRIDEGATTHKSSMLNALFKDKYIFSSCNEPGAAQGVPLTLEGTVEVLPLIQETFSTSFWQVVEKHYSDSPTIPLFLANLHGIALNYEAHLKFLVQVSSAFVVFMGPEWNEREQALWDNLLSIIGGQLAVWVMTNNTGDTYESDGGLKLDPCKTMENGDLLGVFQAYLGDAINKAQCSTYSAASISAPLFMDASDAKSASTISKVVFSRHNGPSETKNILQLQCMNARELETAKTPHVDLGFNKVQLREEIMLDSRWNYLINACSLVLINILGESVNEIKDILEIAFVSLTTLDVAKISPNWMQTSASIWTALHQKVLPTSYQNLVAMTQFLDMQKKVAKANELVTSSLQLHEKALIEHISASIGQAKADEYKQLAVDLRTEISTVEKAITHHPQCEFCSEPGKMVRKIKQENKSRGAGNHR